jgi:hypothetical protein
MTINRKSFTRMSFTCRIKPQTKEWIEMLAAKLSDELDSHVALGVIVDKAVAEMMGKQLPEVYLTQSTESAANAADQ